MGCMPDRDHVVLLHGLGRNKKIMAKMEEYFFIHGFCPHNIDYPSTKMSIEALALFVKNKLDFLKNDACHRVHFVGHSLGGIIIRYLLQHYPFDNVGRVVLIAPPNKGSPVVDCFKKFKFYKAIYGPAGMQLGAKKNSFLLSLHSIKNLEIGVIAGDRSIDLLFSWFLLRGRNDGKVTVESTKFEGMTAHTVVHVPHPFLPKKIEVICQATCFIVNGYFY